jgi:hypothetical protein
VPHVRNLGHPLHAPGEREAVRPALPRGRPNISHYRSAHHTAQWRRSRRERPGPRKLRVQLHLPLGHYLQPVDSRPFLAGTSVRATSAPPSARRLIAYPPLQAYAEMRIERPPEGRTCEKPARPNDRELKMDSAALGDGIVDACLQFINPIKSSFSSLLSVELRRPCINSGRRLESADRCRVFCD